MSEFKEDELKAFLDRHEVRAPTRPVDEWSRIAARLESRKSFWPRIQGFFAQRSFWIPASAIATAGLMALVSTSVFQERGALADNQQVASLIEEAFDEVDDDAPLVGEEYLALLD